MACEKLTFRPQDVMAKLRVDFNHVQNIVAHLNEIDGDTTPTKRAEVSGQLLRHDALSYARHGLLQPPLNHIPDEGTFHYVADVLRAGDVLNKDEARFSPEEKLDYLALAAVSGAIHLLHRVTAPGNITDHERYYNSSSQLESARKLLDLRFDGFDFDEIQKRYYAIQHDCSGLQKTALTPGDRSSQFRKLLGDAGNNLYSRRIDILRKICEFEEMTGLVFDSELTGAFVVLNNLTIATRPLSIMFYVERLARMRTPGCDVMDVPEDERGQAYGLIQKAREFTMAKIGILASKALGIDLNQ